MYKNSNLIITSWLNNELIGISRSITDFCYACYLSDLAVKSDYQKEGIGKRLIEIIKERNHDGIAFLRSDVDILNEKSMHTYLDRINPESIMHLAKSDEVMTSHLLTWSKKHHKKFVFTSSYKVFSGKIVEAPYQVYDRPDGTDDFAVGKIKQEDLCFEIYPDSYVVRLAWQIGKAPGGYNMLSFVQEQMNNS